MTIKSEILQRAETWLGNSFDEETRKQVREMIDHNPAELTDSFYRNLEFGTGGLRGIMGAGTNRMNRYTVGMATQGLANYLHRMFPGTEIKTAISHDSRNNSRFFAEVTAGVLAANGFTVYLFDNLRPTPELSFAIRHLGCQSGVMITASHNPREYNGYKAYWDDGAQFIAPHDVNVILEVEKITSVDEVRWSGGNGKIIPIGREIDEIYLEKVRKLSLSPEVIRQHKSLRIVYTPLHGAGAVLVPEILQKIGFGNVTTVPEQMVQDGNFPTVHSPNPEEHSALDMAIKLAEKIGADLVMATDPDADRVGIAVRNHKNQMVLLNGNQTAAILYYYVLTRWNEMNRLTGKEFMVKTIVTTALLNDIARDYNLCCYEVLTGFKYIADIIRRKEGIEQFIIGGEESYGYLIGDFVRDKDAVSACAMIAEAAAWMAAQGRNLYDLLVSIYLKYGFYKESLHSVTRKGKEGAEEIQHMMAGYRSNPPVVINHSKVIRILDYQYRTSKDMRNGQITPIDLPVSNVLQFELEDGSLISVRPSGTEPKIKFYFGVRTTLKSMDALEKTETELDNKVRNIILSLGL